MSIQTCMDLDVHPDMHGSTCPSRHAWIYMSIQTCMDLHVHPDMHGSRCPSRHAWIYMSIQTCMDLHVHPYSHLTFATSNTFISYSSVFEIKLTVHPHILFPFKQLFYIILLCLYYNYHMYIDSDCLIPNRPCMLFQIILLYHTNVL